MQGVYNYIPEKKHVSVFLPLQCTVHVIIFPISNVLYLYISTFRVMCAVPSMAVFCTSSISCFFLMLLGCFGNDLDMDHVAPVATGISYVLGMI